MSGCWNSNVGAAVSVVELFTLLWGYVYAFFSSYGDWWILIGFIIGCFSIYGHAKTFNGHTFSSPIDEFIYDMYGPILGIMIAFIVRVVFWPYYAYRLWKWGLMS